jgi:hypothetical protein
MNTKHVLIGLLLAFALGGWIGDELRPKPERPVLQFLARAARMGMWLLIVGEPAQSKDQAVQIAAPDSDHINHMRSL